jgi:hypothetical protein
MKSAPRKNWWFRFLGAAGLWMACALAGCGGASPPIGIPAPVSNLMNLEFPDSSGTVAIVGAPGAVLADAIVSGANLTQGGQVKLWEPFFYGSARAQVAPQVERDVVAASDGSFRMRLFGKPGDTIRIVQTVGGETSPGTDLTVPAAPTPGSALP